MDELTARAVAELIQKVSTDVTCSGTSCPLADELSVKLLAMVIPDHAKVPPQPAAPQPPSTDPVAVIEKSRPSYLVGSPYQGIQEEWDDAWPKVKALVEFARQCLDIAQIHHESVPLIVTAAKERLGLEYYKGLYGGRFTQESLSPWLAPKAEPEPKPCPWCGGHRILRDVDVVTVWWECDECNWHSQTYRTREEALAAT